MNLLITLKLYHPLSKSCQAIADVAARKVNQVILQHLPKPSCPSKLSQWQWDVEQVKKKVSEQLHPTGINIEIKI